MNNPGTGETDHCGIENDLVSELESWRETLAKEIAKRNHGFHGSGPDLAVQRIISGILFLRICEEKGIEPYGSLGHILQEEGRFLRFCTLMSRADARYGSGLFELSIPGNSGEFPEGMLADLAIDDDLFGRIVKRTYPPDRRIDFSGITSVLIARVFERLLERTIRISGHRLAIESRGEPGTGPSFPLPQAVIDDMVEQTVGRSARELSPRELSSYRILDPACGSGSVLLCAYRFLLAWHRDWYIRNLVPLIVEGTSIGTPEFRTILPGNEQDPEGPGRGSRFDLPVRRVGESNGSDSPPEWTLTLAEKKRILTSALHGVDTDQRAVEATKCALLLELIADENEASVSTELMLSGQPLLLPFDRNIKCGNPLIGTDYFDSGQSPPYNYRERNRVNPFDWRAEFPGVFERGGFDLVIGNLPSGSNEHRKKMKTYLQTHYRVFHDDAGNIPFFIEKGISLLRTGGLLSYASGSGWLRSAAGKRLRRLVRQTRIEEIITTGRSRSSSQEPFCIFRLANSEPGTGFWVADLEIGHIPDLRRCAQARGRVFDQQLLPDGGWTFVDKRPGKLVEKIKRAGRPLEGYVMGRIHPGTASYRGELHLIDAAETDRFIRADPRTGRFVRRFIAGSGISRYGWPFDNNLEAVVIPIGTEVRRFPGLARILGQKKQEVPGGEGRAGIPATGKKVRRSDVRDTPGTVHSDHPGYPDIPKIVFTAGKSPSFTLDKPGTAVCAEDVFFIPDDQKYLLGILNSRLMAFYARSSAPPGKGRTAGISPDRIAGFPIYTPDFESPDDVVRHDRLETLVSRMLDLNRRISQCSPGSDKSSLLDMAGSTDREIDEIVYDLYGLTADERKIIEEAPKITS